MLQSSWLNTANLISSQAVQSAAMSSLGPLLAFPLTPSLLPSMPAAESPDSYLIMKTLQLLQAHPEGGYFVETDRDPRKVPNPFTHTSDSDSVRNASTTIFYLLTSDSPVGSFHRNKARTVHTLHRGRGRYVIIHPVDESEGIGEKARIETFVVGQNIDKGERLQWIVEGDRWKASFLLPDEEGTGESGGLLISEVSPSRQRTAQQRSSVPMEQQLTRVHDGRPWCPDSTMQIMTSCPRRSCRSLWLRLKQRSWAGCWRITRGVVMLRSMRLFRSLLIPRAEVDYFAYVIFQLLTSDQLTRALPTCRNSEIRTFRHRSLISRGRWKDSEGGKAYESFGSKGFIWLIRYPRI